MLPRPLLIFLLITIASTWASTPSSTTSTPSSKRRSLANPDERAGMAVNTSIERLLQLCITKVVTKWCDIDPVTGRTLIDGGSHSLNKFDMLSVLETFANSGIDWRSIILEFDLQLYPQTPKIISSSSSSTSSSIMDSSPSTIASVPMIHDEDDEESKDGVNTLTALADSPPHLRRQFVRWLAAADDYDVPEVTFPEHVHERYRQRS